MTPTCQNTRGYPRHSCTCAPESSSRCSTGVIDAPHRRTALARVVPPIRLAAVNQRHDRHPRLSSRVSQPILVNGISDSSYGLMISVSWRDRKLAFLTVRCSNRAL